MLVVLVMVVIVVCCVRSKRKDKVDFTSPQAQCKHMTN